MRTYLLICFRRSSAVRSFCKWQVSLSLAVSAAQAATQALMSDLMALSSSVRSAIAKNLVGFIGIIDGAK